MEQKESGKGNVPSALASTTAAILLWSTSFVATKMAYESFSPLTLGAARFVLASIALGTFVVVKRQFVVPRRSDMARLAASGFLGITLYFTMENIGLSLTSATNAALIVASYPAITVLLERIVYGKRISGGKALGVLLAAAGVYCIAAAKDGGAAGEHQLLGNVLLALTGIVWAFYNFVVRSVVGKYPAVTISLYQTLVGTVLFLPLAALEHSSWQAPSLKGWSALVYLGLLCSVAAFMLYNNGLRFISPGTAVTLMNLVPVFGVLFSVLLLGEQVNLRQMLGGAVVIAGVALTIRAGAT